jgi:hypothetical protein
VSIVETLRGRLAGPPSRYERAWLTSINAVGLLVVTAVLLDSTLLLGEGRTGIFRRALYPLVPPAVTLGVAVAERHRRGVALSGACILVYTAVLAGLGTLPDALATAPVYPLAGLAGVAALAAAGFAWTRAASTRE